MITEIKIEKKATTKKLRLFKNFAKNYLLFWKIFRKDSAILYKISEKYFPDETLSEKMDEFTKINTDLVTSFLRRPKIVDTASEIFEASLSKEQAEEVSSAISLFLSHNKLGEEWGQTVKIFVSTGIICPPVFNLHFFRESQPLSDKIKDGKTIKQYKRYFVPIHIVLNPDTVIEDIKDAWDEIKRQQEKSWPGHKGFNLTKNSLPNFIEVLETEQAKHEISEDEKYASLKTELEVILAKKYKSNPAAARKAILKQRTIEKKKSKKVGIKSKFTDEELAKKNGLIGAAAKRKAATIRQRRHRAKM